MVSDAHGNAEAFELALSHLAAQGAERVYFLGDAVGYLPGRAVVDEIVARGLDSVRGNHETMLLSQSRRPADDSVYRHSQTRAELDERVLATLRSWPAQRVLETRIGPVVLAHGSPAGDEFTYVYPDSDLRAISDLPVAAAFVGNTHRPFVRKVRDTLIVNVGSCGLPRDDGRLGSACVFDTETGDAEVIRFDIREATVRALRRCGPVADAVRAVFERRSVATEGRVVG